jgi:hypothetical protein
MNDSIEAIGTAAEGGLFARALSRQRAAPAGSPGHFEESACLNCATLLIGTHCHACGQAAHLHRTLGALGHDLMHGVLHLDGKAWRTLPLLAWRPGELTRRYIHGERAKFVSPMALFLFSIFLMFAVFQAVGLSPPTDIPTAAGISDKAEELRTEMEAKRASLQGELGRLPQSDPRRTQAERDLSELQRGIAALDSTVRVTTREGGGALTINAIETGWPWFDRGLQKWRENPGLMLYKLQANSYKFSWLLIPLSLPFMWLLFAWKRGVRVYDHAIFVTYSIAFMSLLFVAASLLAFWNAPDEVIVPLVTLLPAWHLYRQLRGAYQLRRFSALWRLALLVVMIALVIVLFLQFLLVLGAF